MDAINSTKVKTRKPKAKSGKIVGVNWVWPDGRKTNLRHIAMAIRRKKNLPKGLYAEAKRVNRNNLNMMVNAAKFLKLKCTVTKP